ncbi:alpha-L-rhamnosidase N-terminal domain-containing protein [Paenibacillus sp. MWE-103]|uniref:Alpha-L-rhamnosidase N-terminal domain-containing protein n=1 Tax=Paenibacillus artemisiicola TaxID=1172618 RepID=A0ABS3WBY6_9BACL|nr:alpha-L-rhamnosidase C-terminal domain-containing protein [Paenibacillus artemisiicola]MBO7745846.1 alpha-L-rhamnosidase N-terminal domain-containing protein [Paenibacillus artemisiicola]
MEHQHAWTARWIRPDAGSAPATERMQHRTLYRKTFDVADPAASELLAEVTADSKYRLYVNGTFVLRGPCKGDNWRHYYDTVDLAPYLREGRNAIAVEVVHYPSLLTGGGSDGGPLSEWRADAGGLWLQGALKDKHGSAAETLDTDGTWKLLLCDAVRIGQETKTLFVGGTEDVRGDRIPAGWREAGFDDSAWSVCARPLEPLDRFWGQLMPWQLTPRPIPPLRETEQDFPRLMRAEGIAAAEKSPAGALFPLTVQPGETVALELDAGRLTTGYVQLAVHGGQGGQLDLLYAEAYEYAQPELHGGVRKAVRDDMEGKTLVGNDDRFFPAGWGSAGGPETYEPMGRRAFRFVRVVIRAGDAPLTVARLGWRATGFPLEELGAVRSSDPLTEDMWRISLNTLRGCMQDTYEDTPYYEQMQYIMDAKSQALFTYAVSGDDRLARKTIDDFHGSLMPSGMLQSRYPSVSRQVIPGFALFWVQMVHDHYAHFGDGKLVRRYLPTIDAVLGWFDRLVGDDGLVGYIPEPYWAFVDWVTAWHDNAGAPPARHNGALTVYNAMYALSLLQGAELNEAAGRKDTAAEYRERALAVNAAIRGACYDAEAELYRDGPDVPMFSQHAQIWAVLSGAVEGGEARGLLERTLARADLPATSFSMSHYTFRALAKTGLYGRTEQLWKPWKDQIALGLTAWVEDPVHQRSDCHAWSALPLHEYVAETLGVQPERPGFAAIRIAPKPAGQEWAEGTVPTRQGSVRVRWEIRDGRFTLQANVPEGVPAVVVLPDGSRHEVGHADIALSCAVPAGVGK